MVNGINMFASGETVAVFSEVGAKKAKLSVTKMLLLGILAGFIIGMAANVSNSATHAIQDSSTARLVSGLIFPFGLGILMLIGGELFTGNNMLSISILAKKASLNDVLKNWGVVYIANFTGALLLAAICAFSGQFSQSGGELAIYTVSIAITKNSISLANAIVLGILCNILVCLGILCSLSSKDTIGRIMGAYMPISFFVICGFEHSIANMYYIPAGLFTLMVPQYADAVAKAGIDISMLTWSKFFFANLLPVTLGNIIGGVGFGAFMWAAYLKK